MITSTSSNNVNSLFDSPLPTRYVSSNTPPKMNIRRPLREVHWDDCNLLTSLLIPDLGDTQEMEQKVAFPNLKPRSTSQQVTPSPCPHTGNSKHDSSYDHHHNNMNFPIVVITHDPDCKKDCIYLSNAIVRGMNNESQIGPRKKQRRYSFQINTYAHSA
jgi:hypothetical protein